MAGIFNGHLIEFPQIRVDCFTSPPAPPKPSWLLPCFPSTSSSSPSLSHPAPNAQVFLLTHVHSDHLLGLTNAFTGHIICSPDTKAMLLRLEAEMERQYLVDGFRERRKRKYEGLKAKIVDRGMKTERVVDRIEAVPYGVTRDFELGFEAGKKIEVSITLLDANHCPGSAMFLVKSADRAILHTGDIRADGLFLQSLRRNPAVQEFIGPWSAMGQQREGVRRVLDRIYVDTGAVLGTGDMPDKEPVLRDLLEQMSLYPPDTVFFLNVWCFGWEDVVKEVARHFDAPVHVDRYKGSIYSAVRSDPFLKACTTLDPHATRFHACERRAKCEACRTLGLDSRKRVWNTDKRIVHVNMVEIKTAAWAVQHQSFLETLGRAAVGRGSWPNNIDCPIARHSPLPELQALVKLFRPKSLSPNTMISEARGLDYFLLPSLFSDCLAQSGFDALVRERDEWFTANVKYGRPYIEGLKRMQLKGVELLPNLENGSERDEYLPESLDLDSSAKLGAGRRAHAADQMARAGGLPKTFGGMTPAQGQHISALLGGVGVSNLETGLVLEPGRGPPRSGDDDYNTDEEEDVKRKRRRREGSFGKVIAKEIEEPKVEIPVQKEEYEAAKLEIPVQTDIKREHWTTAALTESSEAKMEAAEVKVEDVKPIIPDRSRRRPRISLNRDHLRALSVMPADVDVL